MCDILPSHLPISILVSHRPQIAAITHFPPSPPILLRLASFHASLPARRGWLSAFPNNHRHAECEFGVSSKVHQLGEEIVDQPKIADTLDRVNPRPNKG